jgi:hypothetical protein
MSPDFYLRAMSHELKDCAWPYGEGDIPGCPLCNTLEHDFDSCPTRQSMSEAERRQQDFDVLIRHRGGLPPIRSTIAWPELAISFDDVLLLAGYPARKAFARCQEPLVFFQYHANGKKHPRLLNDPATATIDVVRQNLSTLLQTEVYKETPQVSDRVNSRQLKELTKRLDEIQKVLEAFSRTQDGIQKVLEKKWQDAGWNPEGTARLLEDTGRSWESEHHQAPRVGSQRAGVGSQRTGVGS